MNGRDECEENMEPGSVTYFTGISKPFDPESKIN